MPCSEERAELLGADYLTRPGVRCTACGRACADSEVLAAHIARVHPDCAHCGHRIVPAPVTGAWVHNLTGERACYGSPPPGYDTKAEPAGDDDA